MFRHYRVILREPVITTLPKHITPRELNRHAVYSYPKILSEKFYHYQFSLISNAADYNTVILDNSLFTE